MTANDSDSDDFEKLKNYQNLDSKTFGTFCYIFVQIAGNCENLIADRTIKYWVIDLSIYKYVHNYFGKQINSSRTHYIN